MLPGTTNDNMKRSTSESCQDTETLSGDIETRSVSTKKLHIDPITEEEIEEENLVRFNEGNKEFIFDINTLCKHYSSIGKMENPYTRTALPKDITGRVMSMSYFVFMVNLCQVRILCSLKIGEIILELVRISKDPRGVLGVTETDIVITTKSESFSLYELPLESKLIEYPHIKKSTVEFRKPISYINLLKMRTFSSNLEKNYSEVLCEAITDHLTNGTLTYN